MHAGLQEVLSGLIQPLVLEKILMEATNVLQSKADIDKEHKAIRALSEAAGCISVQSCSCRITCSLSLAAADCSSSARTYISFDLLSRQVSASTSNPNES